MDESIAQLMQLIPPLRGKPLTVAPLGGGLTNRNYRIDVDGERFVLRVAGKDTQLLGIDRDCEAACARAAAAIGVGPEVIAYLPEHAVLVTRFVTGATLTAAAMKHPAVMRRVTASLRRFHDGAAVPGRFSPFDTVRSYHALAREREVAVPVELERAIRLLDCIERELGGGNSPCPCHNDLLPANLIDDGTAVRIIDWEYGGMGDRFFDLGNLAVNNEFADNHERDLLASYFGEIRSDDLHRLRLMRLASDMREAMWGFLQAGVSKLDFDYLGYAQKHLERFLHSYPRLSA